MKSLVAAVLLAVTSTANATSFGNPLQGSSANAVQGQVQVNTPELRSDVNSDSVSSIHYSNKRNPVSSAISPAVDVNIICPVITVGGHAVQFIGFGGSTTGKANVNAICMAYHLGQIDVVEKMLCATDVEYKKANVNCK